MNIKTKEAIELYNNLEEFIKKDINLPAQCVWEIEDNSDILKGIVNKYKNISSKLLQPLKEKNAFEQNDERIMIKNEYIDEFNEINSSLEEYLDTDNEVTFKKIKRDALPTTLSVRDIRALKFMIE